MRYVLLVLASMACAAMAQSQPTIYVSPDSTARPAVGENFSVQVRMAGYENVRAFSIEVLYNQAALRHTSVSQGDLFSMGGGPGGIFLWSASIPAQGYILADEARIGGGGSSGNDARLFTMHFQTVGPGATNIFFGQILLRDADNEPLAFETADGVVSVVSPLPAVVHTDMLGPDDVDPDFVFIADTQLERRILNPGTALRGKLTAARYDILPPGGNDAPFFDPDGTFGNLGVTQRYWEITSSLSESSQMDLGFSYEGISDDAGAPELRVARRDLGAAAVDTWQLFPAAVTSVDLDAGTLRIASSPGEFGPGQYTLVAERSVAEEQDAPVAVTRLVGPYPNPTRGLATIEYEIGEGGWVRLTAHDLLGRRVALLVDEALPVGTYSARWNGIGLAAGVYIVHLKTDSGSWSRPVVLHP